MVHKTLLKCIVNPILRKIQWWTNKPYVITSVGKVIDNKFVFESYIFKRMQYK